MMQPQPGSDDVAIKRRRRSISNRELLIAAQLGDLSHVRQDLENRSDVNFVDKEGDTVLHYAVRSGNPQMVKEVLAKVEDVFMDNHNNETALTIAQRCKNNKIIQLLQNKILDDSIKFLHEQFPLTTASHNNLVINFIDETFSGNYETSLSLDDVNTILKVHNIKETEAISEENLKEKLGSLQREKPCTFIIQLKGSQWALLIVDGKRGVFYTDSLNNSSEGVITTIETRLKVKLQLLKWQQDVHQYDSCIYVLNNAEIINSNLNDNLEQLQKRMDEGIINCVEERQFLANVLNEIKKTIDKMKFCLSTLQTLNSDEEQVSEFTYRNANAFILFLETFALEDTYPHLPGNNPRRGAISKYLKKLKKTYFTNFYFQPTKNQTGKPDIRLISDVRNKILHSSSKIINPQDFTSFIAEDMRESEGGIIKFFKSLEEYTQTVYDKIENNTVSGNVNCNSFLASLGEKQIIGGENGDLLEIYLPFLGKAYELRDIDEIMFSLTANVIPALHNEKEEMRELTKVRNIQIHHFQQYENPDERLNHFKNIIRGIRSKLFKYYYSREFHKMLKNIYDCAGDDFKISDDFIKKVENIENQFQMSTIENIASTEDVEGNFEYQFSKSLFLENDEDIKESVDQYLKFMVITYNEEVETRDNQFEENDFISVRNKKFTSLERREIFESFKDLKKIQRFSPKLLEYRKRETFEMLKMYGIRKDLFEKIVELYVDADQKLQHIEEENVNQIIDTLYLLKKIKSDHTFSNKKVILLYEHFVKRRELQENQRLQEQFNDLPYTETIELRIGQTDFKINTFNIITDMLEVLYSSYNEYQMKFNNIEEAFIDTTFLNYLIDKDVCNTKKGYKFDDPGYIFLIIKKLLNQQYAAPYIAGLLIKVGNDKIIESNDLRELIGILLNNDVFITHLDKLLHITSDKVNLYEVVCEKIKNIEKIHSILKEPKHAQGILKEIIKAKKNQLIRDILKQLNELALEFYKTGDYNIALQLLDNEAVKRAQEFFNREYVYVIDTKYQIALIKNELGRQLIDKKLHQEAREIFIEITETLENHCDSPKYLLSWIKWLHTNNLLKQHNVQFALNVYERVRRYALGLPFNGDIKEISNELKNEYDEITSSKRYKEFQRNFDIISIRCAIPYSKCILASKYKNKNDWKGALKEYNEALEMYKEIYTIQRERDLNHINHTMKSIAYVHSRIANTENYYKLKTYHQYEALIKIVQTIKSQKETQARYYEKQKIKDILLSNLKGIAYVSKENTNLKLFHTSLSIYGHIYRYFDDEDQNIKYCIAETIYNCAKLTNDVEDYRNAFKMYETIYEIQEKMLGANHKFTKTAKRKMNELKTFIR